MSINELLDFEHYGPLSPIPLDEGPEPLAPILYDEEYKDATAYMRSLMSLNEYSLRALKITEKVIMMNPGHYTAWAYRANTILKLEQMEKEDADSENKVSDDTEISPLKLELLWIDSVADDMQKNYQIWHHRQLMVDALDDPSSEWNFTRRILLLDAKNYHTWTYRKWLCSHFNIWEHEQALIDELLEKDIRNNSAWSHLWLLKVQRFQFRDEERNISIADEVQLCFKSIERDADNESAWNYLFGLATHFSNNVVNDQIQEFCHSVCDIHNAKEKNLGHSSQMFARELLLETYDKDDPRRKDVFAKLVKFDIARTNYWKSRALEEDIKL